MRHPIRVKKYVLAGVITFLVFTLGLALGTIIEYERYSWFKQETQTQGANLESLQFLYLYLSHLEATNASCSVLYTTLEKSIFDLGETLDKLARFQKESWDKEDYSLIKRRYIIDNFNYWFLAKKVKQLCEKDMVNILYFFSETKCDICPSQGILLTHFKKKFGDKLLVFPIDIDLETREPLVRVIKSQYNITRYPSTIVEDTKFEGVMDMETLGKTICTAFKQPPEECKE